MRQASAACSRDGLRMDQGAQGHERHKRRAWHATSSHSRHRPAERSRPSQAHCTFPKARSRPERPCGEGGLRSVPLTTERGRHRAAGPAAIRSVSCRMGRRGAVHRHVAPCHVRQQGAPDRTGQCRRGDVKPAASRANGAVEAETGGGGDHEDTPSLQNAQQEQPSAPQKALWSRTGASALAQACACPCTPQAVPQPQALASRVSVPPPCAASARSRGW